MVRGLRVAGSAPFARLVLGHAAEHVLHDEQMAVGGRLFTVQQRGAVAQPPQTLCLHGVGGVGAAWVSSAG